MPKIEVNSEDVEMVLTHAENAVSWPDNVWDARMRLAGAADAVKEKQTMRKEYGFQVTVSHIVYVEADSQEEAEELAMDQFSDDSGFWDSFDMDLIYEVELENGE